MERLPLRQTKLEGSLVLKEMDCKSVLFASSLSSSDLRLNSF
jgi:hypothetical protein